MVSVKFLSIGGNSKLFIVLVLEISKNEDQKFETFEEKKLILLKRNYHKPFQKLRTEGHFLVSSQHLVRK